MVIASVVIAVATILCVAIFLGWVFLVLRQERAENDRWEQFSHGDRPHLPRALKAPFHAEDK